MPAISQAEVAHLAHLARLDLSEDQLAHYATQLEVILSAVSTVSSVVTVDVPPTSHPLPLLNVSRRDVVVPSLSAAAVLAGAPAVESQRFRVPRILVED